MEEKNAKDEYLELGKQEDELQAQINELNLKKANIQKRMDELENKNKKTYIVRVYAEACMEIGIPAFMKEDAIEIAKKECGNWGFNSWDGFASGPIRAEIVCEEKDYKQEMQLGCEWIDDVNKNKEEE